MEKPTTEEVGRVDLEVDAEPAGPGRRREAHDLGAGFAGAGAAGFCSGVGVAGAASGCAGAGFALGEGAAVTDSEVLDESGEPGMGVSGAVEDSVVEDEGISTCSGGSSSEARSVESGTSSLGSSSATTGGDGDGDGGGEGKSKAPSFTFVGGRARGDIIIPGAFAGSCGLRDQMTYSPFENEEERAGVLCDDDEVF